MTAEQNKAVVRRFYQAFEANDMAALREVLSPDLEAYGHAKAGRQTREEHLQGINVWNAAFETQFTVEEQIAEGDLVATRTSMRAVHNRGDFLGVPPSGKEILGTGITIERVKAGRIVARRVESDWHSIMQQIGLANRVTVLE